MKYDFVFSSKLSDISDDILFALALDKDNSAERIIVGESLAVQIAVVTGMGDVFYDEVRPLGKFLLDFETYSGRVWERNVDFLYKTYNADKVLLERSFFSDKARLRVISPVREWLIEQYASGKPELMFASAKTWRQYLVHWHGEGRMFPERIQSLCGMFVTYDKDEMLIESFDEEAEKLVANIAGEKIETYHDKENNLEYIIASSSFRAVFSYYLHKLKEWKYSFKICELCGECFLSATKQTRFCSDECRLTKTKQSREIYNESVKNNVTTDDKPKSGSSKKTNAEASYEITYNYWYNRFRKLKKSSVSPEVIEQYESEFEKFRDKAKIRKSYVKFGREDEKVFTDWLTEQEHYADDLAERLLENE